MKNKNGYTLVELIITLAILGIIIAPIFNVFNESLVVNVKSKSRIMATNLAQTSMEEIKSMSSEDFNSELAGGFNDVDVTLNDVEYTVVYTIENITSTLLVTGLSGVDNYTVPVADIIIESNDDDDIKVSFKANNQILTLTSKDIDVEISGDSSNVSADFGTETVTFTPNITTEVQVNITCTGSDLTPVAVGFTFLNLMNIPLNINVIDDTTKKLVVLPSSSVASLSPVLITTSMSTFTSDIDFKKWYKITIEVKRKDDSLIIVTNESTVGK